MDTSSIQTPSKKVCVEPPRVSVSVSFRVRVIIIRLMNYIRVNSGREGAYGRFVFAKKSQLIIVSTVMSSCSNTNGVIFRKALRGVIRTSLPSQGNELKPGWKEI